MRRGGSMRRVERRRVERRGVGRRRRRRDPPLNSTPCTTRSWSCLPPPSWCLQDQGERGGEETRLLRMLLLILLP
jgi:hypothetical protein